jgi:Uncharacterized protein conserved in bacteria
VVKITGGSYRLCVVRTDPLRNTDQHLIREHEIATTDLLEENFFELVGRPCGPFQLTISTIGHRFNLHVATIDGTPIISHFLSFTPLLRLMRDYAEICAVLRSASLQGNLHRIEAVDMARRGIHNEASELLAERLCGKINMDLPTARRLFTLVFIVWISKGPLIGLRY